MSITTLLVIVLIVILLGGGGLYGRGRWVLSVEPVLRTLLGEAFRSDAP